MKTVLVLGSTGSIGKSTLEVLDLHKENFKCIGLSANKNFQALHEQANKYSVKNIFFKTKEDFYELILCMNYKKTKENDTYLYVGERKKREKFSKINRKENPFEKLLSLNLK